MIYDINSLLVHDAVSKLYLDFYSMIYLSTFKIGFKFFIRKTFFLENFFYFSYPNLIYVFSSHNSYVWFSINFKSS